VALTFVTGAVRSGKSRFARLLAQRHRGPVTYIATAARDAEDAEFAERVARHRAERPPEWATLETGESLDLAAEMLRFSAGALVLVDSLGTYLAAAMRDGVTFDAVMRRGTAFVDAACACACSAIVVSEETGWGIVPEYPSGRIFRDALGLLNQRLAREADAAYLTVAGYAIDLKRVGMPIE